MKNELTAALIKVLTSPDCAIVCQQEASVLPLVDGVPVDDGADIDHELLEDGGVVLHFEGRKVRVSFHEDD